MYALWPSRIGTCVPLLRGEMHSRYKLVALFVELKLNHKVDVSLLEELDLALIAKIPK